MRNLPTDEVIGRRTRRLITCVECKKEKPYHAKNLCTICYARIRNKKRAEVNNLFI